MRRVSVTIVGILFATLVYSTDRNPISFSMAKPLADFRSIEGHKSKALEECTFEDKTTIGGETHKMIGLRLNDCAHVCIIFSGNEPLQPVNQEEVGIAKLWLTNEMSRIAVALFEKEESNRLGRVQRDVTVDRAEPEAEK